MNLGMNEIWSLSWWYKKSSVVDHLVGKIGILGPPVSCQHILWNEKKAIILLDPNPRGRQGLDLKHEESALFLAMGHVI